MPNTWKKQLCLRYLGFSCGTNERKLFYTLQWSNNRTAYFIYRLIMWIYVAGLFIVLYSVHDPKLLKISYRYFTYWGRWANTVYFSLALALSLVGWRCTRDTLSSDPKCIEWLRTATWLFYSVAQAEALVISIGYWSVVSFAETDRLHWLLNIDVHLINSLVFVIEIFVVNMPMRLLHVIYPIIFGSAYATATFIIHAAGDTSAIYFVLDWGNNPGLAVVISVMICLFGTTFCHVLYFFFFWVRLAFYKMCNNVAHSESESPYIGVSADRHEVDHESSEL